MKTLSLENVATRIHTIFDPLFFGSYCYHRKISSPSIEITGLAHFEKTDDSKKRSYCEIGEYYLNKQKLIGRQTQIFHWDCFFLTIQKNDHRVLHQLEIPVLKHALSKKRPLSLYHTHLCKNDHYSLHLKINTIDSFSIHYAINGPLKNYHIDTQFTRCVGQNEFVLKSLPLPWMGRVA